MNYVLNHVCCVVLPLWYVASSLFTVTFVTTCVLSWLRKNKMADVATTEVQQVPTDTSGSSKPKLLNARGAHAQFLRENPRFLNDPICHVVPSETSRDVEECLSWGVATTRTKPSTRSAAVPCVCTFFS